jgi:predicted ATP-binding protein involved in virulence
MIHVDSLKLENFRGLEDITLDFPGQTTVIVGVNGVGKTAILEGLAIMLSALIQRLARVPQRTRAFSPNDIRTEAAYVSLELGITLGEETIEWKQGKNRETRGRISLTKRSDLKPLNSAIRSLIADIDAGLEKGQLDLDLPIAVFYSVTRAVRDIPMRVRRKKGYTPLDAFEESLDGSSNFRSFFYWFRMQEDLENEQKRDNHRYSDPQLQAVRKAVSQFLPEYSDLRIRRSPLRMTVTKAEEEFDIRQLSDGEKCLLALVSDIARRLALANPSKKDKLKGEGVVLIDEIDLHLHPQWQREIIPALERTFPNCQFIVSTHSPQVLSHIKAEDVWLLKASDKTIQASRPRVTFGMDSSYILEEVMEVAEREPSVKEKLKNLFSTLESGNLKESKNLLASLEQIGDIPELSRARALLKRKEILGR